MDYFYQTESDVLFVNEETQTVGFNNSNAQYDLDVSDTIHTSNLIITGLITGDHATIKNITTSNLTSSNVSALEGDFVDLQISNNSLTVPRPIGFHPNGYIDFSWLTADPLSNIVWTDKWGSVGATAGAFAGGALAATLASVAYSAPVISPAGVEGLGGSFDIAGSIATDDGFALGVEIGRAWAVYVAGLEGGRDAADAARLAVEESIETLGEGVNLTEASAIGVAAGLAAVQFTGSLPLGQGWYSKGL
jgi:hypothetical protein